MMIFRTTHGSVNAVANATQPAPVQPKQPEPASGLPNEIQELIASLKTLTTYVKELKSSGSVAQNNESREGGPRPISEVKSLHVSRKIRSLN